MIKYFVNDSPSVLFVVLFFLSWFARAVQSLTRLLPFYLLVHYLYISAGGNVTSSVTLAAPMQEEYSLCQKTIDFRERQPKTDSTKTQKEH